MVRQAFTLRWLPWHVVIVVAVVVLALLGRWQWDRGMSSTGSLRNSFYGINWWVFAAMAVFGWWKALRDDASGARREDHDAATAATAASLGLGVPVAVEEPAAGGAPATGRADGGCGEAPVMARPADHGEAGQEPDWLMNHGEAGPAPDWLIDRDEEEDEEVAAYNRYLASLAQRSRAWASR